MRKSLLGQAGLFVFVSSAAVAAPELDDVIVTATRTPQSADSTLAATTVITRQQVENSQARSVEDLLRGVDGISIGNSGGSGKLTSFFVRGADADQLLVLVDGIKVGSATAGTAALQNLPLEHIDRIEIVRGPRSSLYGSEAMGGVIQIFTRRSSGKLRPEVSASVGSFDTRQVDAAIGGGSEQAWFSLQGSAQSTDGIDACRGSSTLFAGCFTEEPDRDGNRYRSVSLRGGYRVGAATDLEASFLRAASHVEYDGSYTNLSHVLQQVAGASMVHAFGNGSRLTLRLGRAWDRSDDYLASTFQGDFNTRRDSATAQFDLPLSGAQTVSAGVDYLNDVVSGTTSYVVDSRHTLGAFAQYVGAFGPWSTELSLRSDDNEQFGNHETGSAAVGYAVSDALQFVAQYGTAFRAPTFNELYYPYFGNDALDPERSRSVELAARGRVANARWRVSLFQSRIEDLIGFDSNFLPANVDEARVKGVEASANAAFGPWLIDAGATVLDAENRTSGSMNGKNLPRRPRLTGHLDVEHRLQDFSVAARYVGEGERYDNAANTRRMGGFGTVDLRAEYRFNADWRVQVRVANVLDKQYETVAFYNQPGRAAYMTMRWQPAMGER